MGNFKPSELSLGLILALVLTGCATVSFDQPKSYSQAITSFGDTALGEYANAKVEELEGLSGFYPLKEGMDALGIRLHLAEKAEKSLDLQYFLMKNDMAGAAIANGLLKAANRGVRVRFLLDDIFTTVPDDSFLLINQHPNIEVRIFNPISRKGFSTLNFMAQFDQANRRMHNKSFTADNVISIVGGRNIADEYFQLKTDTVFVDFDVLAVGPIATEISNSFDDYWNHSRAVPIEQFIKDANTESLETIGKEIIAELDENYNAVYGKALRSHLLRDLINDRKHLFAAPAQVLADSPEKLINEVNETHKRLARELVGILQNAEKEIMFITPYYVPGKMGVQRILDLTQKGIRVIVVTNSLASTNHVPVHAAYARYRHGVIQTGAELYEVRANAARDLNPTNEGPDNLTLHTKTIFIDRNKIFVGSLNLDPRSIDLNAEMGLLIESEAMVGMLLEDRDNMLTTRAYEVLINEDGKLEWHCTIENQKIVETKEPLTSRWLRFKAWFLKIAPEDQL